MVEELKKDMVEAMKNHEKERLAVIRAVKAGMDKERIDNKIFQYEEYKVLTTLTMMDTSENKDKQEVRTRFYFEDSKLAYIETTKGEKQELLKVDVSYKADSNLFEIPSNYKQM